MDNSEKIPSKMTISQAVDLFFQGTVSESFLYKLVNQNKIPHIRMGNGKILLDLDYLERWWNNELSQSAQPSAVDNQSYGRIRRIAEQVL